jgi:hypothetical protein
MPHDNALSIAPMQASFTLASNVNRAINPSTVNGVTVSTRGLVTLVGAISPVPASSSFGMLGLGLAAMGLDDSPSSARLSSFLVWQRRAGF